MFICQRGDFRLSYNVVLISERTRLLSAPNILRVTKDINVDLVANSFLSVSLIHR